MLVVLLLIVWPLAELYVVIRVAEAIGILVTVLALIVSWPLGVWLIRAEGRAAWRRLAEAVAAGRPPAREVLDGALIVAGGVLLIVPGFITDGLGLLLLAPPTRALARTAIVRNFQSRAMVRATRFGGGPSGQSGPGGRMRARGPGGRSGAPSDVDSTARDIDQPLPG